MALNRDKVPRARPLGLDAFPAPPTQPRRARVFGACALFLLSASAAFAHSFYEPACCSDRDCAPVADGVVVEKADGVHVKGWDVLSRTDPRLRWSRDDQDHVCQQPGKLLCVYRKPNGM